MVVVTFSCGHELKWQDGQNVACAVCGETRIKGVKAPPPRFTGSVRGPLAVEQPVAPSRELLKGA